MRIHRSEGRERHGLEGSTCSLSPDLALPRGLTQSTALCAGKTLQHACDASAQGSPLETAHSEALLRAGPISTSFLACAKTTEKGYSASATLCAETVQAQWTPLTCCLLTGSTPGAQFSDASRGPVWQAGLSKDSSLRPAMFCRLCTSA